MHYWIQLIISMLQFIRNIPQLMWSWSRSMSDKVCSDMGIFNGSFVDHSWICLLDRASGYVDKSSRRTAHTTVLWKGFRAYLLTVTTDTLRFLAGSRVSPGHRSAASTDNIQTEVAWYTDNVYIPLLYCVLSEDVQCDLCSGVRQECVVDHKIRTPE